MGVRGLTSLITKHVPEALQNHNLRYFNGSRIAIDTSILLYKFRYSNNNENSHISGFLNKCLNYIKYGIIPVFIIDGKPPPEKYETIEKRYLNRKKLEDRIEDIKIRIQTGEEKREDGLCKISKICKQIITVTKEHRNETSELLKILGFNVIQSIGEAEETCAYLQKNNFVNFTYSDDTDVLVLGCPNVLRTSKKSNCLTEINLEKVINGLGVTFDQFIDLCILCGCDYCKNIPKINHQKAYELIKKYGTIENIISNSEGVIPDDFNFQDARNIYNKNIKPIKTSIDFSLPQIDELRLYTFLSKKKYSRMYIDRYVRKFRQAILTNFPDKVLRRDESSERLASFFKK